MLHSSIMSVLYNQYNLCATPQMFTLVCRLQVLFIYRTNVFVSCAFRFFALLVALITLQRAAVYWIYTEFVLRVHRSALVTCHGIKQVI